MEPITILAAINTVAKTARSTWDISESLYFFISSVKTVDQTVNDLHSEVKKLGDACDLAHSQLQGLSSEYATRTGLNDDRLWRCFTDQAEDCERTISQLSRAIGSAEDVRKNPFKRAWRQMQLNMSAPEIEATRSRVRSHTSSLQTILLTINIKVSNLAPRIANQELVTKIGTLTDMVAKLQEGQRLGLTTALSGQQSRTTRDNIIQCAQEVVSDSTTLYEESVAGGSIADTAVPNKGETDHLTLWLRDLELRKVDERSASSYPPGAFPPSTQPKTTLSRKPIPTTSPTPFVATKEQDDGIDSEDEMAADIARASCQLGTNAMKVGNYQEADEFLKEGMSLLQAVPSHQRGKVVYLWGLQYQMAVCTFYVDPPQQAVDALLKVTQREAKDDTERNSICIAAHLLAQAYVKLGKLELARQSCEQALNGRRKLLGKKHKAYQESIALMGRIFELQGNAVRAKVYLGMVNSDVHPGAAVLFEDLKVLGRSEEQRDRDQTPDSAKKPIDYTTTTKVVPESGRSPLPRDAGNN